MGVILPKLDMDDPGALGRFFLPYQVRWILDESRLCLAEKSVRIGWTFADAFKNVRLRLRHPGRDYLFSTKDEATALEYVRQCHQFCEWFGVSGDVVLRSIVNLRLPPGPAGAAWAIREMRAGLIRFVNGSRILAFSSNPNALRAFGGDVGLDEFAFHPDASALWASASGRATWGYNLGIWSSHYGPDTLFARFVREAAAGQGGWSYHRVTLPEAIGTGLVEKINAATGAQFTRAGFLDDCRLRARMPEVFAQEYLCEPGGQLAALVPWQVLSQCQDNYALGRLHLEEEAIAERFGSFVPAQREAREEHIRQFLRPTFAACCAGGAPLRLGFDVAASGTGDLAAFYVDRVEGQVLRLAGLLTCRTQDWQFLKTALEFFLTASPGLLACGDETGLGRQICWEAAQQFPGRFTPVNFAREKSALGFRLMAQLIRREKRFSSQVPEVAEDYFSLRKEWRGGRWAFGESSNPLNAHSHGDLAWAGALASRAHAATPDVAAAVC